MLVEIPDPEMLASIFIAFLIGLFSIFFINKIKKSVDKSDRHEVSSYDRLEFYEKQLIDMKIKLDSLEIGEEIGKQPKIMDFDHEKEKAVLNISNSELKPKSNTSKPSPNPKLDNNNMVDFVLGLITQKSLTSRDIQIASQRSREHVSRLLKKLFQEGYVIRDTKTKPYTYTITEKGKAKLGILKQLQQVAV